MADRGVLVSSNVGAGGSRDTPSAASSFLSRFAQRSQGSVSAAPPPPPSSSRGTPTSTRAPSVAVPPPQSPSALASRRPGSRLPSSARNSPRNAQSHSPGFEMPPSSSGRFDARSVRSTGSRRSRNTNRAWTMSDEIQEYEERVKAARSELQILQDTHTQLTEKLVGANSLNETLQQRLEQAQVDAATAKTEHDETVGDLQDVEAQIHGLNQELAVLRPKAEDATARLGAARSKLQSDEQRLKEQLAQAETQAKRREQELTVRIKQQREALEATRQEADELANIAMTHQQLKQEASRLKQQLVHAKAYTLHKSLAQTIRDSREQTDRLRKIIEHVKHEKHGVDEELKQARQERDAMKQKLAKLVFGSTGQGGAGGTMAMPMALTAATSLSPSHREPRRNPGPLTVAAAAAVAAAGGKLPPTLANGVAAVGGGSASASGGGATPQSAHAAGTPPASQAGASAPASAAPAASSTGLGAGSGTTATTAALLASLGRGDSSAAGSAHVPSFRDLLLASGPGGQSEVNLNRKLDEQQAARLQQMSQELGDAAGDESQVSAWMGDFRQELLRLRQAAVVHTQEDQNEATPGASAGGGH